MTNFIIDYIILFLLLISVLVVLHELGHYFAAKLFKIRTNAFAVGMGPILYRRVDKQGTEWRICTLPIGGYVSFPSLENDPNNPYKEPEDPEQLEEFKKTLYGAHPLKKMIVYFAGPFVNIVVAYLVFASLIMVEGSFSYPLKIEKVVQTPYSSDLRKGDILLQINGKNVPKNDFEWANFLNQPETNTNTEYTIDRGGRELKVSGSPTNLARIEFVHPNSAAFDTGLMAGDIITIVEGKEIVHFAQLAEAVRKSQGKTLKLEVWRAGDILKFELTPRKRPLQNGTEVNENWMIGVQAPPIPFDFELATARKNWLSSLLNAWTFLLLNIENTFIFLKAILIGSISTCNLSGPIGIAEITGDVAQQGVFPFFSLLASISLALAIFNLLPIPPFDGFHMAFTASNWILGGRVPYQVMNGISLIGILFFVCFFLFISWQDIFCT